MAYGPAGGLLNLIEVGVWLANPTPPISLGADSGTPVEVQLRAIVNAVLIIPGSVLVHRMFRTIDVPNRVAVVIAIFSVMVFTAPFTASLSPSQLAYLATFILSAYRAVDGGLVGYRVGTWLVFARAPRIVAVLIACSVVIAVAATSWLLSRIADEQTLRLIQLALALTILCVAAEQLWRYVRVRLAGVEAGITCFCLTAALFMALVVDVTGDRPLLSILLGLCFPASFVVGVWTRIQQPEERAHA